MGILLSDPRQRGKRQGIRGSQRRQGGFSMISFSGGKDSTALLLMLLEKEIDPGDIVFFDTGWEFPQMYQHIKKVESYIGKEIIRLKPQKSFDYWMFEHNGKGKGFPYPNIRWCTGIKQDTIQKFWRRSSRPDYYLGIAYDEAQRRKTSRPQGKKYPLVEWKITERKALQYCYEKGFSWGGLYEHFRRVSCWCCSLQSLNDLRNLRKFYPEFWERLKGMQRKTWNNFRKGISVFDLEERFKREDKQMLLFQRRLFNAS